MLGEVGVPHDDASYGADTCSVTSPVACFRDKAVEFQAVLGSLDSAQRALVALLAAPDLPGDVRADVRARLDEFDGKKWAYRAAAEAINGASALINASGGRAPEVSVPLGLAGLGILPALPVAAVAAAGTAAALVVWGRQWLAGVADRGWLETAAKAIEDSSASPDRKATMLDSLLQSHTAVESARAQADSGTVGQVASIVKWGALALLAYFGFQLVQKLGIKNGDR